MLGVDHDKIILPSTPFPTIPMLGTNCCCNVILFYVGNKRCCIVLYLDLDECRIMSGLCRHGRCINTMGSYRCICDSGFTADPSSMRCLDDNECHRDPNLCEFTCVNTDGSYRCGCPDGYTLSPDGKTCSDVDECAARTHTCGETCVNTPGSFTCSCPDGYVQRGKQCVGMCAF